MRRTCSQIERIRLTNFREDAKQLRSSPLDPAINVVVVNAYSSSKFTIFQFPFRFQTAGKAGGTLRLILRDPSLFRNLPIHAMTKTLVDQKGNGHVEIERYVVKAGVSRSGAICLAKRPRHAYRPVITHLIVGSLIDEKHARNAAKACRMNDSAGYSLDLSLPPKIRPATEDCLSAENMSQIVLEYQSIFSRSDAAHVANCERCQKLFTRTRRFITQAEVMAH
ncbi:MAG: hypothetical protein K0S20_767 [Patescibacteria group bacterium]|nr:hypothetical protein [Patescibacteria group bacterium]